MSKRKQVIIVGGGFGGLAAAKALAGHDVDVLLIDRSNHHLFQPLLYQVATAALSPADIAAATRSLFSKGRNVTVLMDEVTGADCERREVFGAKAGALPYDYLVLATGADYSFFGHDDWAPYAPVLKTLEDALGIRERLLRAFEEAERSADPDEVARLLTFVVVGGGPTGVEMAGAIAELAKTALATDFRHVNEGQVRILLVEAGLTILSTFRPYQRVHALHALRELGVEVLLGSPVQEIDEKGIVAAGQPVRSPNVIWCAGTQARPAGEWLGAETARNKAVIVAHDCSVPGHPDIFAIGDVASYAVEDGSSLPGLAPVAKQQGRYVAEVILARIHGKQAPPPFRYRNWGSMAVIGRSRAVADFGWLRLNGYLAWLTWSLVHLFLLVDFRSRLAVYVNWTWAWFTRGRAARLLTRGDRQADPTISE
jgi:NADH:ubiquinone reductase (H+-translocating)